MKIAMACCPIILLAGFVWGIASFHAKPFDFDMVLDEIKTNPHIVQPLETAEAYIAFLEKGTDKPLGDSALRPIADIHFRLADALNSHDRRAYLERAISHLNQAIKLFPPLRHGWPFYTRGLIMESLLADQDVSLDEIIRSYQQVANYDFGALALRAGYRIARLKAQNDMVLASSDRKALYNYLRFSSTDVFNDAGLFTPFEKSNDKVILYLNAMIKYDEQAEHAIQCLNTYLSAHPDDHSAEYYLDHFSQNELKALYPSHGDLLRSCYAPRSFRDNFFRLLHDGAIRTDIYVNTEPENSQPAPVEITLQFENPMQIQAQIHMAFNQTNRIYIIEAGEERKTLKTQFSTKQPRNLFELRYFVQQTEHTMIPTPYIHLTQLAITHQPPGNP